MRARDLLECGTSNGYATVWLADAVSESGGRVTTVEIEADRAGMAGANFGWAGLDDWIAPQVADAGAFLGASPSGHWDLIFLDAERPHYVDDWPDVFRSLRSLGLLAVDNVLSHADELADCRRLVDGSERVVSTVAPTGAGLLLATKEPEVEEG
jgi:predicted O-methyltransferase YrrM